MQKHTDTSLSIDREAFVSLAAGARDADSEAVLAIPVAARLLSDQLTPPLAYRRLVSADERTAPSFLLESVEGGERQGRHSILGAHPLIQVTAFGHVVTVTDSRVKGTPQTSRHRDPVDLIREISAPMKLIVPEHDVSSGRLPDSILGGWFGYASYDAVRYGEPEKLDLMHAPEDDRRLPDVSFAFYDSVVVFDNATKTVYAVTLVLLRPGESETAEAIGAAYDDGVKRIEERVVALQTHSKPLPLGRVPVPSQPAELPSNTSKAEYRKMLDRALEYIRAGDIFQVVVGQRFEKKSLADPFDVYRSLRAVNPSPYMVYLQAPGVIVVSASPEILCRVRREGDGLKLTNRPLAGTRKRGQTPDEDAALERELLADPKESAEHVMLVDLGRNDVGRVSVPGTVELEEVMAVERYSHVMHISSTVTGILRKGLDCWDALRATLPVGTISGAPKIRAMQIIDELEKTRRGPYGGGLGWVSLDREMDIALALRTIVVPTDLYDERTGRWTYHIQAAGGIVADSQHDAEYEETVNKAAAMAGAVELAERAFGG